MWAPDRWTCCVSGFGLDFLVPARWYSLLRAARGAVCRVACVLAMFLCSSLADAAQEATFSTRQLTPETALKAAQGALTRCRAGGYQVGVAIVDRGGVLQVLLRD